MKIKTPYNAGEYRNSEEGPVVICGHIWWPVEGRNAYHCMTIDANKEPQGEPRYIWDTTDGDWPVIA